MNKHRTVCRQFGINFEIRSISEKYRRLRYGGLTLFKKIGLLINLNSYYKFTFRSPVDSYIQIYPIESKTFYKIDPFESNYLEIPIKKI